MFQGVLARIQTDCEKRKVAVRLKLKLIMKDLHQTERPQNPLPLLHKRVKNSKIMSPKC
jgi:hypothetical protein